MLDLARAEAEAAYQHARRRSAGTAAPPTRHTGPPAENRPAGSMAYDHMPIQLRHAMAQVSQWTLARESHMLFAVTCAATRNKKMEDVKEIFDTTAHVGFDRYWQTFGKCKDEKQWKARCQGVKIPFEAIEAAKGVGDLGRLLAIQFFNKSSPGDAITADLKDKDFFIGSDGTLAAWLN